MTHAERVQRVTPPPPLVLPPTLRNGRRVRWCSACRVLYSQGSHVGHREDVPRVFCEAWMPNARVPCARRAGHRWEHRSQFALDSQSRAQFHRRAVNKCAVLSTVRTHFVDAAARFVDRYYDANPDNGDVQATVTEVRAVSLVP